MAHVRSLELVNRVLNEIGEPAVNAIDETHSSTFIANRIDDFIPQLLQITSWDFAVRLKDDNSPLSSNRFTDWQYNYQLPADFGQFFKFSRDAYNVINFDIYESILVSDTRPLKYYYISNQVNPDNFEPLFVDLLTLFTAARSAKAITEDKGLSQQLMSWFEHIKNEAVLQNSMQEAIRHKPHNDFDRNFFI